MLLKMGEDGVLSQVDEDDLVYVSEKELEDLIKENEQLKQSLNNKMDSDAYWEKKAIQRIKKLENENELLKKQLEQYEAVIDRRWKEYVEKEMTE